MNLYDFPHFTSLRWTPMFAAKLRLAAAQSLAAPPTRNRSRVTANFASRLVQCWLPFRAGAARAGITRNGRRS
jgi:hypothetical protein